MGVFCCQQTIHSRLVVPTSEPPQTKHLSASHGPPCACLTKDTAKTVAQMHLFAEAFLLHAFIAYDHLWEHGIEHHTHCLPCLTQPPGFMMLTPNGRFETMMKICLSISSHHPEHWQPSWSVRTALTAMIAFMPTPGEGALGSLVSLLASMHPTPARHTMPHTHFIHTASQSVSSSRRQPNVL